MTNITSFEKLDKAIRSAGGEPTVLEGLWDGNTSERHFYMNLHVKVKKRKLSTISLGGYQVIQLHCPNLAKGGAHKRMGQDGQ